MYLSSKKHILSNTLILATVIQFVSVILQFVIASILQDGSGINGMPSDSVWSLQHTVTAFSTILILVVFVFAIKKVKGYIGVVDKEDRAMMGRLQEDSFGEDLSALPGEMIQKLLFVWEVILVGVGFMQTLVLVMYRKLIVDLTAIDESGMSMTKVYGSIDGFKNLTMVFTLLLGIVITSVVLENRQFTVLSIVIAVLFLVAFCIFDVKKADLFGVRPGTDWNSVVFYLISTVGMIIFSLYLRIRYRGV
ncbi:MAG: hypothetical protein J5829_01895 [Lachnospiraceae bacterium]|nr:hypothetical protein [Lachnospiraceae bacterium]